jgi:type II secretory pathway pseudopilin PulG
MRGHTVDPITLQNLLDELAREGGNLTDYLAAAIADGRLTAETAEALSNEALESFTALRNAEERSPADLSTMETLVETVEAVRVANETIAATATAEAEQIAALAARMTPATDTATPAEEPEAGETPEGETPAEEPEGETPAGEPLDVANAPVVDLTGEPAQEPALVASTPPARPRPHVSLASIAARTQRPVPTTGGRELPFGGALVASAGAPGVTPGQMYGSWEDLGRAGMQAFGAMSQGQLRQLSASAQSSGQPFRQRNGLANFRIEFPEELTINDPNADSAAILALAADQSRLPGGSLLAANGWCSPSETMYDLCDLPCSLDGILSVPEVNAPRGGLSWTKGIDFAAIYAGTGYFHFTEAQMMADPRPDKPCMEIPCVEFDEARLDVDGLCITGDIMQSKTYPETVAQFMQGAMCAHAHRVNAFKLAAISAGSQNIGSVTQAGYGAVSNVLYAIELQIQAYRYRGRRAQEGSVSILELVAPFWLKGVLRADIANRNAPSGIGNPLMVTDADIVAWFASRGVAIRFVYDWQDLEPIGVEPDLTPVVDYPNTVEFLLYEAGTWVVPMLDLITLESIYDSTLIAQNKFTALFTEQAFTVINRCNGSMRFQVPICANGNTGAQVAAVCA